tara:strand:+ start:5021 stop:5467 length:447 start_codon:yes stop_codon:yes gene_type:complete
LISFLKNLLLQYFSAQFIKFIFAGCVGAFANFSIRIILFNFFEISSSISFISAYLISLLISFLLYKNLVFPYSDVPQVKQALRFLLINFSFLPIVLFAFDFLTKVLIRSNFAEFSEPIAHLFVLGFPALITFLLYKFFAFKKNTESLI